MNKEKICFVCFFTASICYYIIAIMGIFSKNDSNWVVSLCLGSAFLCLATTHINKDKDDEKK